MNIEKNLLTEYLEQYFDEIDYKSFYRALFPVGDFQEQGVFEEGKYNGIIVEVTSEQLSNGKDKVFRHTLTDDLEVLDTIVERNNFCLMSPISYIGKSRSSDNARILYALAIDLDGLIIGKNDKNAGIKTLFHQIEKIGRLPLPTYIVSSGTGLHLYYVLDKPIVLYRNVVKQLQIFKRELTRIVWQGYITKFEDNVQYESLFQGFRVVGTITKNGARAKAFATGTRVSVDYLNSFVDEDFKVLEISYKSKMTLQEAEKKYPDWYQKRIIKKQPKGTWTTKRALYDWWKTKVYNGAKVGHRYYCLMMLCVYAKKSGISQMEIDKDAFEMGKFLDTLTINEDNPFTKKDILKALEAYNDGYITYPINSIVKITDIPITKNKRNYQKQSEHLEETRAIRDIRMKRKGEKWDKNNGRPVGSKDKKLRQKGSGRPLGAKDREVRAEGSGRTSVKNLVKEWQKNNPQGRKADCNRETGLDPKTIRKWWNTEK